MCVCVPACMCASSNGLLSKWARQETVHYFQSLGGSWWMWLSCEFHALWRDKAGAVEMLKMEPCIISDQHTRISVFQKCIFVQTRFMLHWPAVIKAAALTTWSMSIGLNTEDKGFLVVYSSSSDETKKNPFELLCCRATSAWEGNVFIRNYTLLRAQVNN